MEKVSLYGGDVTLEFDPKDHVYFANGDKLDLSVSDITKVLDKPALVGWAAKMCGEFVEDNQARVRDLVVVDPQMKMGEDGPVKRIDEVKLDSFIRDMKNYRYQKLNEAAKIGTMAHAYIESWIKWKLDPEKNKRPEAPVSEAVAKAVDAFHKWEADNKVEYVASERKIYSRKGKYPGTMDIDAIVNGKRALCDAKTGSGIYPEYFYQIAGYKNAVEEEESYIAGKPVRVYDETWVLNFQKATGKFQAECHKGARLKRDEKIFKHCLGIRSTQLIDNPKDKQKKWNR